MSTKTDFLNDYNLEQLKSYAYNTIGNPENIPENLFWDGILGPKPEIITYDKNGNEIRKVIKSSPEYKAWESSGKNLLKKMIGDNFKEYFITYGKNCIIPFHTLFDPQYDKYKFFKITLASKKVYSKIIESICEANNEALNMDTKVGDEFIYKYLTLKKELDNDYYFNKKDLFISNLLRNLLTVEFLELIKKYVNLNYKTKIDEKYEMNKGKKYEEAPMFLERHYKVIYQTSIITKLLIPIAIQYIQKNNQDEIDITLFLQNIIVSIFKYAEVGENMNVYQKIYRTVEKEVDNRMKTDKYGLELQEIYGVTKGSIIDDIITKLLITVIPKMLFDGEIIALMSSVIRTHMDTFLLRGKYPYSAHSISEESETANADDVGNENELFDSYNNKKDERFRLLRQVLPAFTIRDIENLYKIEYSAGELEYYFSTLKKNSLQELMISQVFSKDFGGTENVYGCNKIEFYTLCVILAKRMRRYDINLLADYMTAKKDSTILTRYQYKNINKKLQSHPLYERVLDKYSSVKNLFVNRIANKIEKNPMMENLILILNNNYIKNTYLTDGNDTPLSKNEDVIIDEMLRMYNLLIY